jgi:hypothetical protein
MKKTSRNDGHRHYYGVYVDSSILKAFKHTVKIQGDKHANVIQALMLTYIQESQLGPDALPRLTRRSQENALPNRNDHQQDTNTPQTNQEAHQTPTNTRKGTEIRFKRP